MKFSIFTILFFTAFFGQSQVPKVTYGPEFDNNRKEAFNGFIGESDIAVFGVDYSYVSKKKHELIIRKFYKNDLSLVDSKDIYSNPIEDYLNRPLELFYLQSHFYLFSEFTSEKSENAKVGLFIYDGNGDQISFEIIDTIVDKDRTEIEIVPSKNKDGFLYIKNHPHNVVSRQVLDLKKIDTKGFILWQKPLLSTNSIHKISVERIIENENEVYMLCNYGYTNQYKSVSEGQSTLSNKYTLWVYNHELDFMKEVELRLKNKWINGVDMSMNNRNELVIAGYTNSSRDFGINAAFNVILSQKYEVKKVNYAPFTKEVIKKFVSVKDMDRIKQLDDYYLKDVLIQSDGSFYVIAEKYFKYVDRTYDPRTNITTTTDHYNYDNIIVTYFNKNGTLNWIENIPKFQNSTNDFGYYSSLSWLNLGDKIVLFYNDNDKNIEISPSAYFEQKAYINNRRIAQTYVVINSTGVISRKHLNAEKTSFMLYAKQSQAINHETLYLLSEYGRHSKIISVSF